MSGMFFQVFCLFQYIFRSLDLFSLGSAEAYIGWGKKLSGRSSCVGIILTENYKNLVISFQVIIKNIGYFLRQY